MNKLNDIEKRLKYIQSPVMAVIIVDVLKEIAREIGEENSDLEYAHAAREMLLILKRQYKQQLATKDVISKQTDLLELIEGLRSGEIPEWKNTKIKTDEV